MSVHSMPTRLLTTLKRSFTIWRPMNLSQSELLFQTSSWIAWQLNTWRWFWLVKVRCWWTVRIGGHNYFKDAPDSQAFQKELRRVFHQLHNGNNQRADRMSMANGLEARVPFLDPNVIDAMPLWKLILNIKKLHLSGRLKNMHSELLLRVRCQIPFFAVNKPCNVKASEIPGYPNSKIVATCKSPTRTLKREMKISQLTLPKPRKKCTTEWCSIDKHKSTLKEWTNLYRFGKRDPELEMLYGSRVRYRQAKAKKI